MLVCNEWCSCVTFFFFATNPPGSLCTCKHNIGQQAGYKTTTLYLPLNISFVRAVLGRKVSNNKYGTLDVKIKIAHENFTYCDIMSFGHLGKENVVFVGWHVCSMLLLDITAHFACHFKTFSRLSCSLNYVA